MSDLLLAQRVLQRNEFRAAVTHLMRGCGTAAAY